MDKKRLNLWQRFEKASHSETESKGISLRFENGVDPELKKLFCSFARWLRKKYVFPVHVTVYILNRETVTLVNGKEAYGSFKWFEDRPPKIKIPALIDEANTIDTVYDQYEMALGSFVHELTHYFQWLAYTEQSDAASESQANVFRFKIVDQYYDERNEMKDESLRKKMQP